MNPNRVVVVQTCAELPDVEREEQKPELKSGKRHMVLYVGIMEPQVGLRLLLESIKYLVREKRREDTRFVLVGAGSELPDLKTMVTQWGLDDSVEFTGFIPHEKVCSYLATADVGVAPDPLNPLNDKSTMIKILEYMAYSLPVVLYELKECSSYARGTPSGFRDYSCASRMDNSLRPEAEKLLRSDLAKIVQEEGIEGLHELRRVLEERKARANRIAQNRDRGPHVQALVKELLEREGKEVAEAPTVHATAPSASQSPDRRINRPIDGWSARA
jgi:glycosyltransferase involved in cell wall biosynthesis